MRKTLSSGQKWFLMPYFPLIRGMFLLRSGRSFFVSGTRSARTESEDKAILVSESGFKVNFGFKKMMGIFFRFDGGSGPMYHTLALRSIDRQHLIRYSTNPDRWLPCCPGERCHRHPLLRGDGLCFPASHLQPCSSTLSASSSSLSSTSSNSMAPTNNCTSPGLESCCGQWCCPRQYFRSSQTHFQLWKVTTDDV